MNTLNGYSKSTLTDNYVLTAAGGHLAVGNAKNNIPVNNGTVNTSLNADLLDGYHGSSYWKGSDYDKVWTPSTNFKMTPSASNQEWSFDFRGKGDFTGSYWQVWDESKNTLLKVAADTGKVSAPYGFVGNIEGAATSATKIYVNQHTANDVDYPLVWSNQTDTTNALSNQLYKSYNNLLYNPKYNRITASYFKGTLEQGHITPLGNSAQTGTVKAAKDWIVTQFANIGTGIGANITVSESVISQWSNESASLYSSSGYAFIKIGGQYSGTTYGQWLLSSYGSTRVGYVGRSSDKWTKIYWLATTDDIPTKISQLTNDSGYVTGGPYLPLSGGTLTNDNNILNLKGTTNSYIYYNIGSTRKASTGYYNNFAFLASESGSYARIGVTDDGIPQYHTDNKKTKVYNLLHAGNYTDYTLKITSLYTDSDKLLSTKIWSVGSTNKGDQSTQTECPTSYGMFVSLQYNKDKNQGYQLYGDTWSTGKLYVRYRKAGDGNITYNAWNELAFKDDIPTVTNYYWADQPITSSAKTNTVPTFSNVKTGGVQNTGEYLWKGSSNFKCVPSGNNQEWSFDLGNTSYTNTADSGYTGTYLQVWSAKHGASIASFHNDSKYVGINVTSPEKTLDVNGIQQIYQRGLDNTLFKDLLLLKQQNSSEGAGQAWDESYPSFGIGFRRYWTDGTSPYGETTCAGIYATVSSAWRGGLVFRTKNNTTNGGTHDVTALKLRPDGVAVFANYVYTPSGFVHSGYNSSAHALTSNGGVAKIADMSVNYATSAGSVAWGNITGKPSSFTPSSHTHTYIESKANYTFTSSTLPNSFDWGVSAGFVNSDSGFGSFGSVLTVRTYSGGGGTLQLYAPYSNTYGGSRLKARFGNYDSNTGNSWTTLKEIAWVGDIPTKVSQLTNDSGYITSYKNTWYGDGLWAPSTNITLNASSNGQEWSFDIYRNGKTGCYWHVWDNALSTLLKVNADDGKVSAPYGFVGNLSGTASSASSASVATEARVLCADGTMKLYANYSNEINFGGTNTSGTIYFGYRATDSKPVPTSFVFGDSTGSATLTSSGFKKKGSSDSYVLLGAGGHKALSDFSMAHSHSYHPLGGSWKPSSLSSYTRHWGWAYSSAEAGLASDGTAMQIYTDGKFWQREGAYYCLDNGNTYVSGGTGVINSSTITYVSTAGTANASYYVYDYNATTTPIYIGYAGAALSTATHFAAYGTTSSGARCIKDIPVATVKSLLGIPSVSSRNLTVNGTAYTFYSNTTTAAASFYAPTSVGSSYQILVSSGSTSYPTPYWENRLTYDYPGVIWVGYIYRSARSYTTWYVSKQGGSATVSMYISSPSSSNNYQVALQSSTHTILGGMCSIQAQFNAGKDGGQSTEGPLYAYSTVDVSKIEEAGPDVLVSTVYGGRFYIKAMRASDANNSSYYFDGLAFTGAGKDTNSLPLAKINIILFGY